MTMDDVINIYLLFVPFLENVLRLHSATVLDGFVYDENSDFLFKIITEKLNKSSAEEYCLADDGFLVRIDSSAKQTFIESYLREINIPWKETYYFIDAEKTNSNRWAFSNGHIIEKTFFYPSVMTVSIDVKCVMLDSEITDAPFKWTEMSCDDRESFICQYTTTCLGSAPVINNAFAMTYAGNSIGDQVQYGCFRSLEVTGYRHYSTCLVNRSWSYPDFVCTDPEGNPNISSTNGIIVNTSPFSTNGIKEPDLPTTDGNKDPDLQSTDGNIYPDLQSTDETKHPDLPTTDETKHPDLPTTDGNKDPHLQSTNGNRDLDLQSTDGNRDLDLQSTDGNKDPDLPTTDGNKEPDLPTTDGNKDPDLQSTDGNKDPDLPTTDGNKDPDLQSTDGNRDPDLQSTDETKHPDLPTTDGNKDPDLPTTDGNKDPHLQSTDENIFPDLPTTDEHFFPIQTSTNAYIRTILSKTDRSSASKLLSTRTSIYQLLSTDGDSFILSSDANDYLDVENGKPSLLFPDDNVSPKLLSTADGAYHSVSNYRKRTSASSVSYTTPSMTKENVLYTILSTKRYDNVPNSQTDTVNINTKQQLNEKSDSTSHVGSNIGETTSMMTETTKSCRDVLQNYDYSCVCNNKSSQNTSFLAERIQRIKTTLLLDKSQTTQRKMRKYSARDDRISSISLGLIFGAGVLVLSACAIALSDVAVIYKDLLYGPWPSGDYHYV